MPQSRRNVQTSSWPDHFTVCLTSQKLLPNGKVELAKTIPHEHYHRADGPVVRAREKRIRKFRSSCGTSVLTGEPQHRRTPLNTVVAPSILKPRTERC